MTDAKTLVERLREFSAQLESNERWASAPTSNIYRDVLTELTRLQAELDEVMELLEFADELLSREIYSYGEPGALWLKKTKAILTKQAKP